MISDTTAQVLAAGDCIINGGYPLLDDADVSKSEALAIERVMIAALKAKDANGLSAPIHIPPIVALAIVRAVRGEH